MPSKKYVAVKKLKLMDKLKMLRVRNMQNKTNTLQPGLCMGNPSS